MEKVRCQMNATHAAIYQCGCSNVPVPLCLQCIEPHFEEIGDHCVTKLARPSTAPAGDRAQTASGMCQMCSGVPATDFCCCRFPVAMLCKSCQGVHWKRNTEAVHNFVPITYVKKITCREDIAQLSQYIAYLAKAKKILIDVVRRITACQDALKVKHKQMLKVINDCYKVQLDDLEKLKLVMTAGVTRASEGVKEYLMDVEAPSDGFSSVFWYFSRLKDPKTLELFDFTIVDEKPELERLMGVNWKSRVDLTGKVSDSYIYQNKQKMFPIVRVNSTNILNFLYGTTIPRPLIYAFENHLGLLMQMQKSPEMVTTLCENMISYIQEAELTGPTSELICDTITLLLRTGFTNGELKEVSNLEYFLTRKHRLPIELSTLVIDSRKTQKPTLAEIRPDSFGVFDCNSKEWVRKVELSRLILVSNFSATTFLPNGHILACGGNPDGVSIADAYDIEPENGSVTKLSDMKTPRHGHGLIAYYNFTYVFGGYDTTSIQTCEKFLFRVTEWLPVPNNMITARSWFNPCLHKHLIYLCGGNQVVESEIFDPSTETFSPMIPKLPDPGNTRTVVVGDTLIVLSWNKISKLNLAKNETEFSVQSHWTYATWGAMSPLVVGPEVMFVAFNNGAIRCISLSTGQKVREDLNCPYYG